MFDCQLPNVIRQNITGIYIIHLNVWRSNHSPGSWLVRIDKLLTFFFTFSSLASEKQCWLICEWVKVFVTFIKTFDVVKSCTFSQYIHKHTNSGTARSIYILRGLHTKRSFVCFYIVTGLPVAARRVYGAISTPLGFVIEPIRRLLEVYKF
jgi:hypothetical protein